VRQGIDVQSKMKRWEKRRRPSEAKEEEKTIQDLEGIWEADEHSSWCMHSYSSW